MESQKKYGPYNQYIPHKDVVYSLIGYHVYLEGLLVRHSMEIKVICQRRGGWKCILSSTLFETSMAFFSDAEHIREDIERCANRIHEEEEG